MFKRKTKQEPFVPVVEKPKPVPKPKPTVKNKDVEHMSSNPYPTIPKEVLDALSRIETKLGELVASDKKVHEQIEPNIKPFIQDYIDKHKTQTDEEVKAWVYGIDNLHKNEQDRIWNEICDIRMIQNQKV